MKTRHAFTLFALAMVVGIFAAVPAGAQTPLLNISQDVPLAVTLDNPCTAALEAIAFTGTTHIDQQVWLMPRGTLRLITSESALLTGTDTLQGMLSPTYTASGSDPFDAEFSSAAVSIYDYKKVTNSVDPTNIFYVVVQLDFDPSSLHLGLGLSASCSDGTAQ